MSDVERFSPGWTNGVVSTFVFGLAMLILLTFTACKNAPVVPARVVNNSGTMELTGDNIRPGQQALLKFGLMDIGTIWGHCAYLAHDFDATTLHDWALPPGG